MRRKKGLASVLMIAVMVLGLGVTSLAAEIDTAGNEGSADLKLSVEIPTFSVTVPTQLPVDVDKDGIVTTATDAKIINSSHGPVEVVDIAVNGTDGWTIVAFDHDMSKEKVNSKKVGLKINDFTTDDAGVMDLDGNNPVLDGKNDAESNVLAIDYDASVSSMSDVVTDSTIGTVVFTIDWASN